MDKRFYQKFFAHPYETLRSRQPCPPLYLSVIFPARTVNTGMIANFPMLLLRPATIWSAAEELIRFRKRDNPHWLELEPKFALF